MHLTLHTPIGIYTCLYIHIRTYSGVSPEVHSHLHSIERTSKFPICKQTHLCPECSASGVTRGTVIGVEGEEQQGVGASAGLSCVGSYCPHSHLLCPW